MRSRTKPADCCDTTRVVLPSDEAAERFAQLAWALAHPARVRILNVLLQRESCICGEIVSQMPLAQSTISQHLKILKESGLIRGEIDGPRVCYGINKPKLAELKALVASL